MRRVLDDLKHAISAHHRIVHDKAQRGSVLQNDRPGHQTLEAFMTKLLFVNSSIFGKDSKSRTIAQEFIDNWRRDHPDTVVVTADFQGR